MRPYAPVGTNLRSCHVIESGNLSVEGKFAYLEYPSDTQTEGHCPLIRSWSFPVCSDNRRKCNVPGLREVVVYERLGQKLVHAWVYLRCRWTCERPNILDKKTYDPGAVLIEEKSNCGWSTAPFVAAKIGIRVSWKLNHRTYAPDELAWLCRGQKPRELHVANSRVVRRKFRVNNGYDSARDQVPILTQVDRDYRLDVGDKLSLVLVESVVKIDVALDGYAYHVCHGVLGSLRQVLALHRGGFSLPFRLRLCCHVCFCPQSRGTSV